MKKIPSVFVRDFDGPPPLVKPGQGLDPRCSGWVDDAGVVATVKVDGTAAMVRDGKLYKRYDRKPTKSAKRRGAPFDTLRDFKTAPAGWERCDDAPDAQTGHWPGWLAVGDGPEDQWFRAAFAPDLADDGTYELLGPKVQGNPYRLATHVLVRHGSQVLENRPVDYDGVRAFLEATPIEGIVWHHPDGRMAKIKRRDFGFEWPAAGASLA